MIGDYNTTETVHLPFNTFSSNDPSASVTITNLVAGDIHIHKDGGVTQRSSSAGVTISIDFDGITGNHMGHIDLSDNTDAGFYADGSTYQVRIEGTTVDGGTINAWIGTFSIGRTLRPTTAGRTLDVTAAGEAGLDLDNTSGTLDAAQIGADAITAAKIADDAISSEHINTGAFTADAFAASSLDGKGDWNTVVPPTEAQMNARTIVTADYTIVSDLAALALEATVDAVGVIVTAIEVDTGTTLPAEHTLLATEAKQDIIDTNVDTLITQVGTAGDGLTDLGGMSTGMKAEVNAECDTAISDAGLPEGIVKNATFSNFEFLMVDSTDGFTPETGLTVTGQRSIDAGAFANVTGAIAEIGSGIYQFDAAAADTNGDLITWKFASAGAADRFFTFKTSS